MEVAPPYKLLTLFDLLIRWHICLHTLLYVRALLGLVDGSYAFLKTVTITRAPAKH